MGLQRIITVFFLLTHTGTIYQIIYFLPNINLFKNKFNKIAGRSQENLPLMPFLLISLLIHEVNKPNNPDYLLQFIRAVPTPGNSHGNSTGLPAFINVSLWYRQHNMPLIPCQDMAKRIFYFAFFRFKPMTFLHR